ncbi:MAG: hypothetical protein ACXABI_11585 [Candidatus Hodarchaeales archaeon]
MSMILNAEIFQIEEDFDNNLWIIDFKEEEKAIRGKIEIPSKIVNLTNKKNITIEVVPSSKEKEIPNDAIIALNVMSFRTKPLGKEKIYSFSAGGLIFRLFSTKDISEFKSPLREYRLILK